jgi:hypothetical protein
MSFMAKNKKTGGKHSTPRKPVQFPTDWLAIARKLAAAKKMPVLWVLIELVESEARTFGLEDLPPPPWGEDRKGNPQPSPKS